MASEHVYIRWLEKAEEDFQFAKLNFNDETNMFYAPICFHFQQSAEKYLKAYAVAKEGTLKKVHDLTYLVSICVMHDKDFTELMEDANFLTDFYVEARYPLHI